jgi:hypothetical protein
MAGRMGGKSASMNSVLVLRVDPVANTIIVSGSVPGHKGCAVRISDAAHRGLSDKRNDDFFSKSKASENKACALDPFAGGAKKDQKPLDPVEIDRSMMATDAPTSPVDTLALKQVNQ